MPLWVLCGQDSARPRQRTEPPKGGGDVVRYEDDALFTLAALGRGG